MNMNTREIERFWLDNRMKFAVMVAFGFLMFAFELANFTLSIDEEIALRHVEANINWVRQGRWGMYLANALLLPSPIIPFLPLALAIAFTSLAFVLFSYAMRLNDQAAWYAAAILFIGCPTLLYAFHFDTYNFGIGLGYLSGAFGIFCFLKGGSRWALISIFPMAFAIATYQSFLPFLVSLFLASLLVRALSDAEIQPSQMLRQSLLFLSCLILSVGLYLLMEEFFLWFLDTTKGNYTALYLNLNFSLDYWERTLPATYVDMNRYLLGKKEIYGVPIPALPYLVLPSLALICVSIIRVEHQPKLTKLATVAVLVLFLFMPFSLNLINWGHMPTRSLVTLPFTMAIIVYLGIACSGPLLRVFLISLAAFTALNFASSINNLALRDHLSLEADKMLALRIQTKIDEFDTGSKRPLPLEVVGQYRPRPNPELKQLQTIGGSFFKWGDGNIHRVIMFMHAYSLERYRAATLADRRNLISKTKSMAAWPSADSIAMIDGVVVIKFGDYSHSQIQALCGSSKDEIEGCPNR